MFQIRQHALVWCEWSSHEVFTKFTAFWEVIPYTLSATNQHFGEPSCNHLPGTMNSLQGVKSTRQQPPPSFARSEVFIAVWLGITFFWNIAVREWVTVPEASKQASGIFTLKIRKCCLETSGSDYPVTQATHRHTPQDRNHQILSLSLSLAFSLSLSLSRLFDSCCTCML